MGDLLPRLQHTPKPKPAPKPVPKGGTAVRQRRHHALNKLDYFPTPPWATRAVLPVISYMVGDLGGLTCWEPACGGGHMAGPLTERFGRVIASDVFAWSPPEAPAWAGVEGPFLLDFLDPALVEADDRGPVDLIITNPPFTAAQDFARLGMARARRGVCLLVRSAWLEGVDRYTGLFRDCPPSLVAQYVERVPMVQGRWDPAARSATAYAWVMWFRDVGGEWPGTGDDTLLRWIPPGQMAAHQRRADFQRFADVEAGPLFPADGVGADA